MIAPLEPPQRPLPEGACDTHAHVFGPFDRFPLQPERTYTPPLAPWPDYREMLDCMGLSRSVVVQASAYGTDNRCTLDAVARAPERTRGIGVLDPSISDDELERLYAGGIRGFRFTEMKSRGAAGRFVGAAGFDDLEAVGPRLKAHGMHAQIYAPADVFVESADRLLASGIPLVLDHMGKIGPFDKTLDDPAVRTLERLVGEGRVWLKMTVFRNSRQPPHYEDVRPFHDLFLAANPERLVWGSDWPMLNTGDAPPSIGKLLDLLDDWVSEDVRQRILVDNPAALYGF